MKDEDGNEVRLRIDGFIYKSVKSTNPDELNLAFFPDVIDKWAHLQYVLRGRLNDLGDTITGFKGVYNGKEIQWSEVEKQYKFAEL